MPALAFSRTPHKAGAGARATRDKIHYLERTSTYAPAVEAPLLKTQDDCRHKETLNLPSWARTNKDFFIQADHWEGVNRDVFVEWKFDLPKDLSHDQHIALTRDIFAVHLRSTHPVTWVKHEPLGLDGTPHPHVHALWSARPVSSHDLLPNHFFSRRNPKTRDLGECYAPAREKQLISDVMNLHMEAAGLALRYSPLPYKERGLEMTPEPKALPSDSYLFAHTGEISPRLQRVFDHRKAMEPYKAEEARDARERWDARKVQLGITQEMAREEALGRITDHRDPPHKARVAATKERTAEAKRMMQHAIAKHEQYGRKLDDAIKRNLAASSNPVALRKLDYLLSYDLEHDNEPSTAQGSPFQWQKDTDADLSR